MATLAEAVHVATPDGAVWRTCAGCRQLAALPGDVEYCEPCETSPSTSASVRPAPARRRGLSGSDAVLRLVTDLDRVLRELARGFARPAVAGWLANCARELDALAGSAHRDADMAAIAATVAHAAADRVAARAGREG